MTESKIPDVFLNGLRASISAKALPAPEPVVCDWLNIKKLRLRDGVWDCTLGDLLRVSRNYYTWVNRSSGRRTDSQSVVLTGMLGDSSQGSELSIAALADILVDTSMAGAWTFTCRLSRCHIHTLTMGFAGNPHSIVFEECAIRRVNWAAFEKSAEIKKSSVRELYIHSKGAVAGFDRIDYVELGEFDGDCIVKGSEIGLVKIISPKARILFSECRVKYREDVIVKLDEKLDVPTMMKTYEALGKEDSIRVDRDVVRRYKAYFESREGGLRKMLYWFNGGYYEICRPLCGMILSALAIFLLGAISTGDCNLAARSLFQPTKLFGLTEIVFSGKPMLSNPPCWHSLAPNFQVQWLMKYIMPLPIVVYIYSVFSFFVAVKRRYGFGKPAD